MTLPSAAHATAGIVLCVVAQAAGAYPGSGEDRLTHDAAVRVMIDCRLWLSAIEGCPRTTFTGAQGTMPAAPAPHELPGPDREGIERDTYYFLGLQLSIVGALYFMPESMSGWSDQEKNQHHAKKWWNNVTGPTWDNDDEYINYVLHPYWGAAYYVRARERGYEPKGAFLYSFLLSTLYETGLEALFEPVSIQDLFVTPIVGSWVGGYFMDWRRATEDRIARTSKRRFRDKALLVATDPLGSAADFVDRRLGRDAEFSVTPLIIRGAPITGQAFAPDAGGRPPHVYGLKLTLRW